MAISANGEDHSAKLDVDKYGQGSKEKTIVEAYEHFKETGEIVAPKKYPKGKKEDD